MFTRQVPDLVRRLNGQIPEPAVSAIEDVLGNCDAELEHRGPIAVEIDGNFMPDRGPNPRGGPLGQSRAGGKFAAILASNPSGHFSGDDCESDHVTNGLALRAKGLSYLDSARIDRLYVGNLLDNCGDPLNPNPGTGAGTVMVRFRVRSFTSDPNVVLAYLLTFNGNYYVATDTVAIADFTPTTEFKSRWRVGHEGWATRVSDRLTINLNGTDYDSYEVTWVETKSRYIEYMLSSSMSAQRANAVPLFQWGSGSRVPQIGTVSIYDRMDKIPNAQFGYRGIAIYDEQADEYISIEDDDRGLPLPPDESIYCVKVNSGDRLSCCVYDGSRVDLTTLTDYCKPDESELEKIWIYAPNWTLVLPADSYHYAVRHLPDFDCNGETRPIYSIKSDPNRLNCIKIEQNADYFPSKCIYNGKLIEVDISAITDNPPEDKDDACLITATELSDVKVYFPNADGCVAATADEYVWGVRIGFDSLSGLETYISLADFGDCAVLGASGALGSDFGCDSDTMSGMGDKYYGIDTHEKADPIAPFNVSIDNGMNLCGRSGEQFFVIDREDHEPPRNPFGMQIQRDCVEVVTGLGGAGACDLNMVRKTAALMNCGVSTNTVITEGMICNCKCDEVGCGCPVQPIPGETEGTTVTVTVTFTGIKRCDDTFTVVTEEHVITAEWEDDPQNIGEGGWYAYFECDVLEPSLLRLVEGFKCFGEDESEERSAWAQLACNWDKENILKFFDDEGDLGEEICPPFPGQCDGPNLPDCRQYTEMTNTCNWLGPGVSPCDGTIGETLFTFCIPCKRHYRFKFTCTYEPNVPGEDPILRILIMRLEHLTPVGYKGSEGVGVNPDDVDSRELLLIPDFQNLTNPKVNKCTGFSGEFDVEFGRGESLDFQSHTYCSFRTQATVPPEVTNVGTVKVEW